MLLFDSIVLTMVREFVSAAHGDLDQVKHLLEQDPRLLHASMNWSGEDWETALGAAAHVGRRDIAEYLLEQGARMDIFAAAMLGHLELVRSMISLYPQMAFSSGPHGIPLMRHAVIGGEAAKPVVAYLEGLINPL